MPRVEAEASLSFAGLSELLAPVFDEVADSLLPPRRRALEVALLLVEPGEATPDAHAIGLAVLDLLRARQNAGPFSWRWTTSSGSIRRQRRRPVALRRLRDEPVRLLATVRLGPDLASPVELDRTFPASRLEQISLGPLSVGAVHTLLEERLGLELTRPGSSVSGKRPGAMRSSRSSSVANSSAPVRGPLPARRCASPRACRSCSASVWVGSQPTPAMSCSRFSARPSDDRGRHESARNEARVLEALEAAVREGVVEFDGSNVRFAHPLISSICYEQAPVWKRRAVHRALAEWSPTSRSRPATSRSRRKGPTLWSPLTW